MYTKCPSGDALADWLREQIARDAAPLPVHAQALTGMHAPSMFGPAQRQPHVQRLLADTMSPRAFRRRQQRASGA